MKTARLSDRPLPQNVDAERFLIGSVILEPDHYPLAAAVIRTEDFALRPHQLIWDALTNLRDRGQWIDRVAVINELHAGAKLEAAGGFEYLNSLDDGIPAVANLDGYIQIVHAKSLLRQTIHACYCTAERCYTNSGNPSETIAFAQEALNRLQQSAVPMEELQNPGEIIEETGFEAFMNPARNQAGTVQLPWPTVSELIPALRPQQLIVLAARPGFGKSALAAQIGHYGAMNGIGVPLFSLEMSKSEILMRIACMAGGVDGHAVATGRLTDVEKRALAASMGEIEGLPLYIGDRAVCTVPSVRAAVSKLRARRQVGLVIVDYLQLMQSAVRRERRHEEVASISRDLKLLAKELNLPVVAVAQLSRAGEQEKRRPQLSDLGESGAIERDADVICFLHQVNGARDWEQPDCEMELIVAKHRGGKTGTRKLRFIRMFTKFVEWGG